MKGSVKIIKSFEGEDTLLFEDGNMIVDGARQNIVDMLTHTSNPSATNGIDCVSSHQVMGWTLSPSKDYYNIRDSRYLITSSLNSTSGTSWSLVRTTDSNYPVLNNLVSGTRLNQYAYIGTKDIKLSEWKVDYFNDATLTTETVTFGSNSREVVKFTYNKGDARAVLRKKVNIDLGKEYRLQYESKGTGGVYSTFRLGRGNSDRILEYYDFDTQEFTDAGFGSSSPGKRLDHNNYFSSKDFRFIVKGNNIDRELESNTVYYIEHVVPSYLYEQDNPFVTSDPTLELVRFELIGSDSYILKNPNFLETQSKFVNNQFKFHSPWTVVDVPNPVECTELGLVNIHGWDLASPAKRLADPADSYASYGYVQVYDSSWAERASGTDWSDIQNTGGVLLHTSSNDFTSSGYAALSQTKILKVDNLFYDDTIDIASNMNEAYGLEDSNQSYWLEMDVLPKGTGTVGPIEVIITRVEDGATYKVTPTPSEPLVNIWNSNKLNKISIPVTKNAWNKVSVPVVFGAKSEGSYKVTVQAQGRTDADGFIDYFIRDFTFGELTGWSVFPFGYSSLGTFARTLPSNIEFRGMASSLQVSSAGQFNSNPNFSFFSSLIFDKKRSNRQQIVTRFQNIQPQKCYNLAVKWKSSGVPAIDISLKAFARTKDRNLLSNWFTDATAYSGTTPSQLNPYFSGTDARRTYYPKGVKAITDPTTKASDISIELKPEEGIYEDFRVNDLTLAKLSIGTLQRGSHPAYFALSAVPKQPGDKAYVFDWEADKWVLAEGKDLRYGSNNSTSGNYFLPLLNTDRSKFVSSEERLIPFRQSIFGFLAKNTESPNGNGLGKRGDFVFRAVCRGPLYGTDSVYFKNIKLLSKSSYFNIQDAYKQLYFDFSTKTWVPGHRSHIINDADRGGTSKTISNMHMAGLGPDTVYQLNIADLSGISYDINEVSLCDITYFGSNQAEGYNRDPALFTSEPYTRNDYTKHKGFTLRQDDGSTLGSTIYLSATNSVGNNGYEAIPIVLGEQLPATNSTSDGANDVLAVSGYLGSTKGHLPVMSFSFTPAEYGLVPGEKIAIQFTTALKVGTQANCFFTALASDGGVQYSYIPANKIWNKGFNFRTETVVVKSQASNSGGLLQSDILNFGYSTFEFVVPSISENGNIIISLAMRSILPSTATTGLIKEIQLFRPKVKTADYKRSGDTFLFPEFPSAEDAYLQSKGASGNNDELGHLPNRINFFAASSGIYPGDPSSMILKNGPSNPADSGERSFFEALDRGGYVPSSGMYFPSGTFGSGTSSILEGKLNSWGVIDHDGFIYRHPHLTPLNGALTDSSAGFVVSSYTSVGTNVPTVRYLLKLHKDDWKYIDYYMGGIGAMGLWSVDLQKTFNRGVGNNYFNFAANAFTATVPESLYIHDYSQRPSFRLNAKKVMFPPGLFIDYNTTDYITLIWDIHY